MQYMLLIYSEENSGPQPGSEGFEEYMKGYFDASTSYRERGIMVSGDALANVSTASTVRIRDGEVGVTDGPFAETKETLGGYYLLDCKDLDEAIECAAMIPGAKHGSIEIRPLMVFD